MASAFLMCASLCTATYICQVQREKEQNRWAYQSRWRLDMSMANSYDNLIIHHNEKISQTSRVISLFLFKSVLSNSSRISWRLTLQTIKPIDVLNSYPASSINSENKYKISRPESPILLVEKNPVWMYPFIFHFVCHDILLKKSQWIHRMRSMFSFTFQLLASCLQVTHDLWEESSYLREVRHYL